MDLRVLQITHSRTGPLLALAVDSASLELGI